MDLVVLEVAVAGEHGRRTDVVALTAGTVCTMVTMTFEIAGRPVGRIGFGAMQLPGPGVMGPPRDHDEAIAVLRRAVEAGVNHIDTAQYYGPNVANELIREALYPYPDDLVIVSKVGAVRDDGRRVAPGADAG